MWDDPTKWGAKPPQVVVKVEQPKPVDATDAARLLDDLKKERDEQLIADIVVESNELRECRVQVYEDSLKQVAHFKVVYSINGKKKGHTFDMSIFEIRRMTVDDFVEFVRNKIAEYFAVEILKNTSEVELKTILARLRPGGDL